MKTKDVPIPLRQRVRQYLNEHWYEEGNRDTQMEQEIISTLAPELREELMYSSFGVFLQTIPFFVNNFTRPFLRELSLLVLEISYSQGEKIVQDRSPLFQDDQSFYYIVQGTITIEPNVISSKEYWLKKLKEGEYFGEWSFFTGMSRQASAEAHTYARLYKIPRADFLQTLNKFPFDFEKFCMMKDRLIFSEDYSVVDATCWTCGKTTHLSTICDATHYNPPTQIVIDLGYYDQKGQERAKIERRDKVQWPTIVNQAKLTKTLQKSKLAKTVAILVRKYFFLIKKQLNKQNKEALIKQVKEENERKKQTQVIEIQKEDDPAQDSENVQKAISSKSEIKNAPLKDLSVQATSQSRSFYIHMGLHDMDRPRVYKNYFPNANYNVSEVFKNLSQAQLQDQKNITQVVQAQHFMEKR